MPKKTTILIVVLIVITGLLVFLAVSTEQNLNNKTTQLQPTEPLVPTLAPSASLGFSVPELNLASASNTATIDVVIDTSNQQVSGAQVELSYDPEVLTNVRVNTPADSFFGNSASVLINEVDAIQGRISYATIISTNDTEKIGNGKVVTITFSVNRNSGANITEIQFLPRSSVTTLSSVESILKETKSLPIIISNQNTIPSPTNTSSL